MSMERGKRNKRKFWYIHKKRTKSEHGIGIKNMNERQKYQVTKMF